MQETTFFLISFILISSSLQISTQTLPLQSPSVACKSTIYPKLCLSILSAFRHSPLNPDGYGEFTTKQCLKHASKLSDLINHFLTTQKGSRFLSYKEQKALDDCSQLADLTVDYLESISAQLKLASDSKSDDVVGKIHTLLSAVVTNQQTCFDGLKDASAAAGGNGVVSGVLFATLSNASMLYSVSLGLVSHAMRRARGGNRVLRDQKVIWAQEPSFAFPKVILNATNKYEKGGRRLLVEMINGGVHVSNSITVNLYGGGNFSSIGDAIAFAPNNSRVEDGYFVIYVNQGYYEEHVTIPKHKKNIMLLGDGINRTVIAGNRSVVDGWTTFQSATFAISGERFVAIGITFLNLAGPAKHQAVAVRNNADLSTFYRCSFVGYQDTLYVHSLRQFYRECDIYGTVDFIFGNAAAVFQNCNLYARKPMPNQKNAFTAQSRSDPNQNTGISIQNCTIEAAPDLAMDLNSTLSYLGRPWKEYSRTVYMQSYIGNLIDPIGWLEWNATVSVDKLYYGEYENYGPGANTTMRVLWPGYNLMNVSEAMNFTVYNFTMGETWLPSTNIPFCAGL